MSWKLSHRLWQYASERQLGAGLVAPVVLLSVGVVAGLILPSTSFPVAEARAGTLFQTLLLGTVTLGAFVVPILILHVQFTINRRFSVPTEAYWKLTGLEAAASLIYSTLLLELLAFWLGQHAGGLLNQALATGAILPSLAAVAWLAFVTIRTVRFSKPGVLLREWLEDIRPRLLEPVYRAGEHGLSALILGKHTSPIITVEHLDERPNEKGARSVSAPLSSTDNQVSDIDVAMLNRFAFRRAAAPGVALHVDSVLGDVIAEGDPLATIYGGLDGSGQDNNNGRRILSAAFRLRPYEEEPVAALIRRLFDAVADKVERSAYRQAETLLGSITEQVANFHNTDRHLRTALSSIPGWPDKRLPSLEDETEGLTQLLPEYWYDVLRQFPDRRMQSVVSFWASLWELAVYSSAPRAMASAGGMTAAFEPRIQAMDGEESRGAVRHRLVRSCWQPIAFGAAIWSVDSLEELSRYLELDIAVSGLTSVPLVQLRSAAKSNDIEAFRHYLSAHREHLDSIHTGVQAGAQLHRLASMEFREQNLSAQTSAHFDVAVSKVVSWALANIGEKKLSVQFAGEIFRAARSECSSTVAHLLGLLEHSQSLIVFQNDGHFDWQWELPRTPRVYTVSHGSPWITRAFVLDFITKEQEQLALPELEGDILHTRPQELFHPIVQEYEQSLDKVTKVLSAAGETVTAEQIRNRLGVLRRIVDEWQSSLEGMRERWIARQPLDGNAIRELILNTQRTYRKGRLLSLLLQEAGRVQYGVEEIDRFYLDRRLHHRGAFVSEWPVDYTGFAEQVGRNLARAEDQEIGQKILEADPTRTEVAWGTFDEAVDQAIDALAARAPHNLAILLSDPRLRELLDMEPKEPKDPQNRYFLGRKSGCPVISCPGIPNNVAVIFDLLEAGRLEYRRGEGDQVRLESSVDEIGEDQAADLLDQQPELAEHDGERMPEDAAMVWLQTQVDWTTRLYVRYVVENPEAARVIEVDRPPEGEEFLDWLRRRRRRERDGREIALENGEGQ